MSTDPSTSAREDLAPLAALLVVASLAFVHLMSLPAFEDEGSQLRWIFRLIRLGDWRAPLGEGKPLEAWLIAPFVAAGAPALGAARTLHVLAGMLAAVLTYRLARRIGDRGPAFASGLMFVLCPFAVYLERLALSDMFLCAAGLWVLCGVLELADAPDPGRPFSLAAALVVAAFCKFPVGFVFAAALPLALLLMPHAHRLRLLRRPSHLAFAYAPVSLLAAAVFVFAVVRLHRGENPGFGLADFAGIALGGYQDIAATVGLPRATLWGELTAQLSAPVVLLGAIGLVAAAFLGDWRARWLIAAGLAPMLGIGLLADFWYSRYLLFTLPPLIVSAVYGWHALAGRLARTGPVLEWAAFVLCGILMAWQSTRLVLTPATAHWSALDRFQYAEGWPSGYGYPDAARFLLGVPNPPQRLYALDGHSAYQLLSYLPHEWTPRIASVLDGAGAPPLRAEEARLARLFEDSPTWIIARECLLESEITSDFGRSGAARLSLQPIARFDRPGSRCALALYAVASR